MQRRIVTAAVLTAGCACLQANAALVVSFDAASIPAQGRGVIDVKITPDADLTLEAFGFGLTINSPYGVDSTLLFLESVLLYHTLSDYVFVNATPGPAGDVPGPEDRGTFWVGLDVADSPVDLVAGTTYLLTRIDLVHSSLPLPYNPTGQEFTVSLSQRDTNFFDDEGDAIDFVPPAAAIIEILPASTAAVPEPAGWLIFAALACAALPWRRRRRDS